MYYALIIIAVVLFGGSFLLQDEYRKRRGSGLKISMESAFIASVAGMVVLLIINGFSFEYTHFTLIMAICSAVNSIAFAFFALKALEYINLSLFSLFSMLGGMALPFFQGIFFYDEDFTLAKAVCIVFIVVALLSTIEKDNKKNGSIFYVGVFILNGMSGVISKIFTASSLLKTSSAGYSIWICICTIVISAIAWTVISLTDKTKKEPKERDKRKDLWCGYGFGALYGVVNKIGNFLLVIALVHVDASVQYPMVTGGTMIVSTLLCYLGDKKPSKKEICSVALAFIGMLALFLIPV